MIKTKTPGVADAIAQIQGTDKTPVEYSHPQIMAVATGLLRAHSLWTQTEFDQPVNEGEFYTVKVRVQVRKVGTPKAVALDAYGQGRTLTTAQTNAVKHALRHGLGIPVLNEDETQHAATPAPNPGANWLGKMVASLKSLKTDDAICRYILANLNGFRNLIPEDVKFLAQETLLDIQNLLAIVEKDLAEVRP